MHSCWSVYCAHWGCFYLINYRVLYCAHYVCFILELRYHEINFGSIGLFALLYSVPSWNISALFVGWWFPTVTIQTDLFLCFSFHKIHLFVEFDGLVHKCWLFFVVGLDISLISLTRFSYKTWSIIHVCRSLSFLVSHIASRKQNLDYC
jgi:hypothetical protein